MIDLTRDQLSLQLDSVDAIDAKLGLFLGVGSALIAVLMGVLTVQTQALGIWAIRGTALTVGNLSSAGECMHLRSLVAALAGADQRSIRIPRPLHRGKS